MNKHCKGCSDHHNANHPKDSPLALKYNDWCCSHGTIAEKAISWCITHDKKLLTKVKK